MYDVMGKSILQNINSTGDPQIRMPEIQLETTRLADEVGKLTQLACEVRERLSSILTPDQPIEGKSSNQDPNPLTTQLGGNLFELRMRVTHAESILLDVLSRCEL